jgi:hypothetical protein
MARLTARKTGFLSTLILLVAVLGIRAAQEANELLNPPSVTPVKVEKPSIDRASDFRTGGAF